MAGHARSGDRVGCTARWLWKEKPGRRGIWGLVSVEKGRYLVGVMPVARPYVMIAADLMACDYG